ncbi:MAG TPA: glycoside hydrolase family 2 TIM barrel-domain containing protein, partial [Gaiellales bacterium]|nr:glycoside hydrolase family 2 TIM barrel-domain containing protein [Gaiellales bacterium]
PFELHLKGLKRGTNRLVVQVDNRMHATDLPPGKVTVEGAPNGGWWNWGGILRDVYLRRVRGIDISQTQVLPRVKCQRCSASIAYRVTVRNYRRRAARVRVTTRFGSKRATIGVGRVRGGSARRFSGSVKIAKPKLWSPPHPTLYPVKISASGGGSASWSIHSGVRQFTVRGGRLLLNGLPVNLRGVFLHEDGPGTGGAVTHGRMNLFFKLAHQIGATALRTHYPMSPYIKEQADRRGFLIWEEVPVFQVSSKIMRKSAVRKKAIRMVRADILANSNHPSVFTWSVANELPVETTAVEARYFRESARAAHRLDPTRPVSTATPGYASVGCRKAFKPLDLLGVNTYFGWYPGRMGALADRTKLGPFLDQARRCYPKLALMVTEFGAEANRNGPPEDRGTYAFQAKLNDFDLWTYSQKPWLSGAIGMLIEFHVRPGWFGGNPFPTQPLHQKAVFDFFGRPKPAAAVLSRWFHRTQQYDLPPGT